MSVNCDPSALASAAECFRCVPRGYRPRIRTYLLCQFVSAAGDIGGDNLLAGANYTGQLHRLSFLTATPGKRYRVVWGANDLALSTGTNHTFKKFVIGSVCFIVAESSEIDFYGVANGAVTAQMFSD